MNNQAGVKMDGLNKRMNGQTNARMWWMIKWRMSGLALHRVTPSNMWLVKAAKCDYAMTQLNSVILAICSSLLQPLMQRDTTLQTTQPVLLKAYPLFFFFWLSKTDYIQLTPNLQSNVRRRRTEADGGVVVVVWFTVGQAENTARHSDVPRADWSRARRAMSSQLLMTLARDDMESSSWQTIELHMPDIRHASRQGSSSWTTWRCFCTGLATTIRHTTRGEGAPTGDSRSLIIQLLSWK